MAQRLAGVYVTADGEWRGDGDNNKKVLYLCDGPPKVTYSQSVVFTSPNDRWLDDVANEECTYWMPPWKLKELQLAAAVLGYPMDDDELKERFWNFGGVARHCLNLTPEHATAALNRLVGPITKITSRGELENLLRGFQTENSRHRLLHYQPVGDAILTKTKLVSNMLCEKVSQRLLDVMQRSMHGIELMLQGVPEAASLRGWIFKGNAHAILQGGLELRARALGGAAGQATVFTISKTAEFAVFKTDALAPSLLTSSGPYHKPKSKTLESIDGFYFSKEAAKLTGELRGNHMKKEPILLFQMTVSKRHRVRASRIIYVLQKLGLLEIVEKDPKRAALIFLNPHAKGFKRQKIIVSGGSPKYLKEIRGIGPLTLKTLALYGVKTVEELKDGIKDFRDGKIVMQDLHLKGQGASTGKGKRKRKKKKTEKESNVSKHAVAWRRAVSCWESHVESLSDPKYIQMVESIPQYVSDAAATNNKKRGKKNKLLKETKMRKKPRVSEDDD